MGTFFVISVLLKLALCLGLAFIIWVIAAKEGGSAKTIGITLSVIIIVLVLISTVYDAHSFKHMRHAFGPGKYMTNMTSNEASGVIKEEIKHRHAHSWKKNPTK